MSDALLVGTRKGLFVLVSDGRGGWAVVRHAFKGIQVSAVCWDAAAGLLYTALNHGHFGVKLHRSRDFGANWLELPAPAFPLGFGTGDAADAPSVSLVWTLEATGAGRLWAGTLPGALFTSTDNGTSWQVIETLWLQEERAQWFGGGYDDPGIHSVLADPRDRDRLLVGVSCGGVWLTPDAGETWVLGGAGLVATYMPEPRRHDFAIQDPHRLARCTAVPDRVWMQHHNGVFRSDDGGLSWMQLEGLPLSDFGFAVAAHPEDPDTAWFVPAERDETRMPVNGRFAVTRTRDGGQSFELLDQGLPAPPAFDLVYRHAFEVAPDGRTLAMGSTTGNLWTSADGGECWQLVTAHLPPIACLRFARRP
jgi:hypothetical protein